jgi:ferredoxin-NADP reductase
LGHVPAEQIRWTIREHRGVTNSSELSTIGFVISSKAMVTVDVALFTIRRADGLPVPEWNPGAHVAIRINASWTRQYSLCGDVSDRDSLQIAVQREADGRGGSRYFVDTFDSGSPLEITALRNNFALVRAKAYTFIAGGIGITPFLPMIQELSALGAPWKLFYGGRALETMAFAEILRSNYAGKVMLVPQDTAGLLDLNAILAEYVDKGVVYCCGPESLIASVEKECGAGRELHIERFSPREDHHPAQDLAFEVEVGSTGQRLMVPVGVTIVEVLEDAGVEFEVSCEEGTCGTCQTRVLSGVPDHRDSVLSADEQDSGASMMICVSRSRTRVIVLDI